MRYKVVVSYLGKNYVGWQRQKNGISIQEKIEDSLKKVTGNNIYIVGSGRTDGKVNAYGQVFHFDSDKVLSVDKWKLAINNYLPDDIYVRSVEEVSNNFSARYCVLYKIYEYKINLGEYNIFNKDYVVKSMLNLDIDKMKEASKYFIGIHDFTSFCSNPLDKFPNQVREIFDINFSFEDDILTISFKGRGFLRYMVRMMVASLLEVGKNRKDKEFIKYLLEVKDKNALSKNAIASGLTLKRVEYFNLIYFDDNYLIRDLYEEDNRIIKNFNEVLDYKDKLGYFKREDKSLIGIIDSSYKVYGDIKISDEMYSKIREHFG